MQGSLPLHLLLRVGPIDNFIRVNLIVKQHDVSCRAVEYLRIGIPELDNTEPLLGAHCDTDNRIDGWVRAGTVQGSGGQVALIDLCGIPATDLQTIAAAADVGAILPHRRGFTAHTEHHTVRQLMSANFAQEGAKCLPAVGTVDPFVAVGGPGLVLWLVKV